jgi:hypothetical protein
MRKFQTFEQFWPDYLREHSHPRTRGFHFAGTTIACLMTLSWIATGDETFLMLALLGGYGLAWFSHFVIEFNRPLTVWHPIWHLRANFRMYRKWLNGSLSDDLGRAGIRDRRVRMPFGQVEARLKVRSG